jgi:hypothetical protein
MINYSKQIYKPGPQLSSGRSKHSCGRVRRDDSSIYFSVIVVGGIVSTQLTSTEILDDSAGTWRSGPSLPVGISSAALVEDNAGGVVLIGGTTSGLTLFFHNVIILFNLINLTMTKKIEELVLISP